MSRMFDTVWLYMMVCTHSQSSPCGQLPVHDEPGVRAGYGATSGYPTILSLSSRWKAGGMSYSPALASVWK